MLTPEQVWETGEKQAIQAVDMYTLLKDQKVLDRERWLRCTKNFLIQVDLQLKAVGKNRAHLAKTTGLSEVRISQIFSSTKKINITIKTLHRIAAALDCSLDVRLTTFMGQQSSEPTKPLPGFEKEMMNL